MTSIASVHMYGFYHMGDVLLENNRTQDIGRFGVYSPIDFKERKKNAGQKNIAQRNPTKYHGIHWKIRTVIFSHGVQHSLMDEIGLIRGRNL